MSSEKKIKRGTVAKAIWQAVNGDHDQRSSAFRILQEVTKYREAALGYTEETRLFRNQPAAGRYMECSCTPD